MNAEKLQLEKIGLAGSVFATLCCLGLAPLIGLLTAIGAGFLVHDAVLLPFLIVFLIVGAAGLHTSFRRHGSPKALILHVASAAVVVTFTFLVYVQPLVWAGIAGLLAASVWNWRLRKACSLPAAA